MGAIKSEIVTIRSPIAFTLSTSTFDAQSRSAIPHPRSPIPDPRSPIPDPSMALPALLIHWEATAPLVTGEQRIAARKPGRLVQVIGLAESEEFGDVHEA